MSDPSSVLPPESDLAAANDGGKGGSEIIALSQYRARLARSQRKNRLDTLMSSDNPERAIAALSGDEIYSILRESDFREAADLLRWASVEQVQVVADFSLWAGDRPVRQRLREWIEVMAELPYETVGEWFRGLDIELLALLVRKAAHIYDLSEEEAPEESEGLFFPTPDRLFVLDVVGYRDPRAEPSGAAGEAAGLGVGESAGAESDEELASAQGLITVLENLYRADNTLARRILVGAKAEMDSELEETAFRWRQGRMADHGFVDALEAQDVYRELDVASVRLGELPEGARARPTSPDERPSFWLAPGPLVAEMNHGASLFVRALRQVTAAAELEQLHFALVALSNRVLSADRVDPADEKTAAGVLERMRATLDLAVELLARDASGIVSEERALAAVRTVPLTRLFRLGVSLIGKVRRLARTWLRQGPFATLAGVNLIEEPEATVFDAVNRLRALYPRILDRPPAAGERPFASLGDLAKATASIQKAAVAERMLLGLGVRPEHLAPELLAEARPSDPVELDAGLLARTALVLLLRHRLRDPAGEEAPAFRPLTEAELADFAALFREPPPPRRGREPGAAGVASIGLTGAAVVLDAATAILRETIPPGLTAVGESVAAGWVASLFPLEPTLRAGAAAPPPRPAGADRKPRRPGGRVT